MGTLVKPDLATRGDVLLLYGELDATDEPKLGAVISSVSYSLPLRDAISFTSAFGYSRRNLVELPTPLNGFSTSQYQALGQLEWVFRESLRQRWSVSAAFSGNRSNTYLNDAPLPRLLPASVRRPSSGYLKVGLNGSGRANRLAWSGNAFVLQGVPAATPSDQRDELSLAGIEVGSANAVGGLASAAWGLAPGWELRLMAAGQLAFNPLTSAMRFVLGADTGLRGLPGQLVSGDSGWLGSSELAWTVWQGKQQALQLVPFIGAGGVDTELNGGLNFTDTVGSGGVLARWLSGRNWMLELGWVEPFETNNNAGVWQDWALGQGLYAKVQFQF